MDTFEAIASGSEWANSHRRHAIIMRSSLIARARKAAWLMFTRLGRRRLFHETGQLVASAHRRASDLGRRLDEETLTRSPAVSSVPRPQSTGGDGSRFVSGSAGEEGGAHQSRNVCLHLNRWIHRVEFLGVQIMFLRIWSVMYSACRAASATIVSVGFSAAPVVN